MTKNCVLYITLSTGELRRAREMCFWSRYLLRRARGMCLFIAGLLRRAEKCACNPGLLRRAEKCAQVSEQYTNTTTSIKNT